MLLFVKSVFNFLKTLRNNKHDIVEWSYWYDSGLFESIRTGDKFAVNFYWFALDLDGNLGLFFINETGKLPTSSIDSISLHKEISCMLFYGKRYPQDQFKLLVSGVGCYLFEWDEDKTSYLKIAHPSTNVKFNELSDKIPTLEIYFNQAISIHESYIPQPAI